MDIDGRHFGFDPVFGMAQLGNSPEEIRLNRAVVVLMNRGFYHYLLEEEGDAARNLTDAYRLSLAVQLHPVATTCATVLLFLIRSKRVSLSDEKETEQRAAELLAFLATMKPTYLRASLTILKMLESADGLDRDLNTPYGVQDKEFSLAVAKALSPLPVSTDPDDHQIISELYFRDYLRALMLVGRWQEAVLEFSAAHNKKFKRPRATVLVPAADPGVAGLRLFHNANEDPISFILRLPSEPPQLLLTDVPSIDLFRFHHQLSFRRNSSQSHLTTDESQALWALTFGVTIQASRDFNGRIDANRYRGTTLHEILQSARISGIRFVPHGILFGLPVAAAARMCDGVLRYAIQDYAISYSPPWIPVQANGRASRQVAPAMAPATYILDRSTSLSGLSYPEAELRCLNLLSPQPSTWEEFRLAQGDGEPLRQLVDRIATSSRVQFSCHGTLDLGAEDVSTILLNDGQDTYRVSASTLLDLRSETLTEVFLNCCNATGASPGTCDESYTLPVYFIAAGAAEVVSTTLPVSDRDAFRFSIRMRERQLRGESLEHAFHATCLESISGTLPFHTQLLERAGFKRLASESRYLASQHQNDSVGAWMSYCYWRWSAADIAAMSKENET